MRKKCLLLSLLLAAVTVLSSCSLLPEEEPIRTATRVHAYSQGSYTLAEVERGDLIESARISCRYVPVQSASLSFAMSGEYIDKIMVQTGDTVQKGQLLGQLQLGDLEERISKAQLEIAELELRLEDLNKRYGIRQRRQKILDASLTPVQQLEAHEKMEKDFASAMGEIEDALELKRLLQDSLQKELNDRQIRAPFDGTITHVARIKEGEMSSFGSTAVTLVDSTMSLFRAETDLWNLFENGDEHEIVVAQVAYPAVVVSEEELGLPVKEKAEGKKASVYFALKEPAFELEDGDSGAITLIVSEHLNVLSIPEEALAYSNEQPIVYCQREDGMKEVRNVQVGVVVDKRIEILSGLSEGESVIVN